MSEMIVDCPRCGTTRTTADVLSTVQVGFDYGWSRVFEAFCCCRHCGRSTIFVVRQTNIKFFKEVHKGAPEIYEGSLVSHFEIVRFVSLIDQDAMSAPEHTPDQIAAVFAEASACVSMKCWNATGAMLRLSIDLATKQMLPPTSEAQPNAHIRGKLAPRLEWLFEQGKIPKELKGLSECIRQDGNDGAHDGTLTKAEAEDLLDFTIALFERIYTEPKRLEIAESRRLERRKAREQ